MPLSGWWRKVREVVRRLGATPIRLFASIRDLWYKYSPNSRGEMEGDHEEQIHLRIIPGFYAGGKYGLREARHEL